MEKWAIITLSQDGVTTARRLSKRLDDREVSIFTKEKYAGDQEKLIKSDISTFFGEIIKEFPVIIAIMATGIVVRAVAPYLVHKSKDPAILVMDTKGEFVISLLSGHLGGANDCARIIEKRFGSKAVITTGTDVKGTMAVDVLAEKINCQIADFTAAKDITAQILNGEKIGILSEDQINLTGIDLPYNIVICPDPEQMSDLQGLIRISSQLKERDYGLPQVRLVPKNIVIGIGCRRNVPGAKILAKIEETFLSVGLDLRSIKLLATVTLKADEAGITEACQVLKAKKVIIPDEMVKMVQNRFEGSDFVFQTTGMYAVSEPCGYIASGFGECLIEKKKLDGITLSVWRENIV
ncbi:cobalt-precorrin 5A hydrolase [Eubacteriaceae bacterium ES2]|nr:cobalt-precorrin 5A hydrolase [Eubacteriaceae bacterium ES2]